MHLLRYSSPQRANWAEEVLEKPGAAQSLQQSSWVCVGARLQLPGEEASKQCVGLPAVWAFASELKVCGGAASIILCLGLCGARVTEPTRVGDVGALLCLPWFLVGSRGTRAACLSRSLQYRRADGAPPRVGEVQLLRCDSPVAKWQPGSLWARL